MCVAGVTVLSFRDSGDAALDTWAHWGQLHQGSAYNKTMPKNEQSNGGDTDGGDGGNDATDNGGDGDKGAGDGGGGGGDGGNTASTGGDEENEPLPPETTLLTLNNHTSLSVCYHLRQTGGHKAVQNVFSYNLYHYPYFAICKCLQRIVHLFVSLSPTHPEY